MTAGVTRPAIRPGDRVWFDDGEHTVLGWTGANVRLLSDSGEQSVLLVAHLLTAPGFAVLDTTTAPLTVAGLSVLSGLPSRAIEQARWWERHVVEIETGLRPGVDGPGRPEYDPARHGLDERDRAKVAELTAAGHPCSLATIRRRRYAYGKSGLAGLVDQRARRGSSPTGDVDDRVVAAVRQALAEQTDQSTGTRTRLRRRVEQLVLAEHGPDVPMPSSATFYRLVARLGAGRYAFEAATTRRSQALRPTPPFGSLHALRPGEWVQIDTSPLDVMAVLDSGVTGRVELTQMVDVATRSICAGIVRPAGSKAVDAAVLLARSIVPEPMRPGWPEALRMRASLLPHALMMAVDERFDLAAAQPVIVPETIVSDRGAVFMSQTFTDACTRLGISLHPARSGTPTDKPMVERTFGSVRTLFCQYVAGYTGRDAANRGARVEQQAAWTVPQLQELFDQWVVAGWQPRPHSELRLPELSRATVSPNEMYAALVSVAGYLPLPLAGDDYLELLPVVWRKITDSGIELDSLIYDSADLSSHQLRNERSPHDSHRGRWPIHHDPYDRGQVWVRAPGGSWLEVPWVYRERVRAPFADFTVRHVRAQIAARGDDNAEQNAIARALDELLDRAGAGPYGRETQRIVARTRAATRRLRRPTSGLPPTDENTSAERGDRFTTGVPHPRPPESASPASPLDSDSSHDTYIDEQDNVNREDDEIDGFADSSDNDSEQDRPSDHPAPDSTEAVFQTFDPQTEAQRIW